MSWILLILGLAVAQEPQASIVVEAHRDIEVYVAPIDCTPIELESDAAADGFCTAATPCGRCNGECDNDSHCAAGLVCFQRDGHTAVPGCISNGAGDFADYDYCVEPTCVVEATPFVYKNLFSEAAADGFCTAATPCGTCHGECDNDSHCAGALICF